MGVPRLGADPTSAGKKLKRRLEDLERRAGSTSPPPEQQTSQMHPRALKSEDNVRKKRTSRHGLSPPGIPSRPAPNGVSAFAHRDDSSSMFARQHTRQLSTSPPPAFTYSFPPSDPPSAPAQYSQQPPFTAHPYPEYSHQTYYLPPLSSSRPNLGPPDATAPRQESNFPEDDLTGHFHMTYSSAGTGAEAGPSRVGTSSDPLMHVKWPPGPNFQPLSPPVGFN